MRSRLPFRSNTRKKRAYRFGIIAEYVAAFYLMTKGYRIIALRYRNPCGEVDILAGRRDMLVAVEVKARKNFAACVDSITWQKQKRIEQAMQWLMQNPAKMTGLAPSVTPNIRFDVLWVVPYALPKHIKDAWRLS